MQLETKRKERKVHQELRGYPYVKTPLQKSSLKSKLKLCSSVTINV